ncbi:WbqC family protein [Undibacterium sp. TJN19]|uniref:WbqC family protein n=1 Tax=Undibacterium sp. TJN19 TaxID=3413055 RepID=UPI003BF0EA0B
MSRPGIVAMPNNMMQTAQLPEQKKVAIMQPYFFPYIGYFQLISAVDVFVIYDNIKYTKKGWINRNRILQQERDRVISLPLKHASDFLDVCERELADNFDAGKLLNQIKAAYQRAPYFKQVFPLIESILKNDQLNLFHFLHNSIVKTCNYLGIQTKIIPSSGIDIDHTLKNQDKVLAICQAVRGTHYLNPIGGLELYSNEYFLFKNIQLHFIQSDLRVYPQFGREFVPWLSIIDIMMFNAIDDIADYLDKGYTLL